MKFSTMQGVGRFARQCYLVSCQTKPPVTYLVERLDTRDELSEKRGEFVEDLITIFLGDREPHHIVQIGSKLDEVTR